MQEYNFTNTHPGKCYLVNSREQRTENRANGVTEAREQSLGLSHCLRWTLDSLDSPEWRSSEEKKKPRTARRRRWSGEAVNPEGGAGVEKK